MRHQLAENVDESVNNVILGDYNHRLSLGPFGGMTYILLVGICESSLAAHINIDDQVVD